MTGYALKCLINSKVHLDTFNEVESVVQRQHAVQQYQEDWAIVRVRVTEIKPRVKAKRKASK